MAYMLCFVGIDVSKNVLDVHLKPQAQRRQFANDAAGIAQLIEALREIVPAQIVLEPSGGYEEQCFRMLHDAGLPIQRVDATRIRLYAFGSGKRAKTDRIDAAVLARVAGAIHLDLMEPAHGKPLDTPRCRLRWAVRERERCVRERAARNVRLQKLDGDDQLRASLERHIAWLSEEIKAYDRLIAERLKATPEIERLSRILQSVPGIGPIVAAVIIARLPELGKIHRRQIASLAGVAPVARDSGTTSGKRRIWGGRADLRRALSWAAVSASRCNDDLSEYYKMKRQQGKETKVALTIVMRKLLTLLNTLVHENREWTKRTVKAAA